MKHLKFISSLILLFCTAISFQFCADGLSAKDGTQTSLNSKTKIKPSEKLDWKSVDQLDQLPSKNDNLVLVDLYTDWCKWCKVMDQQTFSDPSVMSYLQSEFDLVKFNAEHKNSIQFKGDKYNYINQGRRGVNQLAVELSGASLSYPSFIVLDQELNTMKVIKGFKKPNEFLNILKELNI